MPNPCEPVEARQAELSLADAARRIPSFRPGKRTHPATLTRWILKGVSLSDGSTLKLAARRYPGGWSVTEDALRDFTDALTADRTGGPAQAPRTPAGRRRDLARVDRELAGLGL